MFYWTKLVGLVQLWATFFSFYKSGAKKVGSLEVAIFGGNRSRHLEKEKKRKKNWSDPESGKMSATDASNKFKGPFSVFVEYFLISYCTPTPHKRTLSHLPLPLSSLPLSLTHTHMHTLPHTHTHTLSHNSSPACFYSSNPKQLHFPK